MRKLFFIWCITCLAAAVGSAQREYNTWHFGSRAGVSFNTGAPASVGGPIDTDEGCSIWCDPSTGQSILSTDGITVYDRTGSVLANGTGLQGGFSSSNSALIVPNPADATQYYIFCVGDLSNSLPANPYFTVNIAQMNPNGSGSLIVKNDTLLSGVSEKLSGTIHCNGKDWWIVAHDSLNPTFYVFRLTKNGLSAPATFNIGSNYSVPSTARGGPYGMGTMKFSPSGKYIAIASPFAQKCEIFDFDINTGVISNPRVVDSAAYYYGLSFSPNETMLYAVCWSNTVAIQTSIVQYSILNNFSKYDVGSMPVIQAYANGGIQRGPDGKIYLTNERVLRVINQPNNVGASCGFSGTVSLGAGVARIGLPNIMDCMFDNGLIEFCAPPVALIGGQWTACVGSCLTFSDSSELRPTQWEWTFQGGIPATFVGQDPPQVCFNEPGIHNITLIATNKWGSDTVDKAIEVIGLPLVNAGDDLTLCDSSSGRLNASGAARYEWSPFTGLSNQFKPDPIVRVFTNTEYVVTGWDENGCSNKDTIVVRVRMAPYPTAQFATSSLFGLAGSRGSIYLTKANQELLNSAIFNIEIPVSSFFFESVSRGVIIKDSMLSVDRRLLVLEPDLSRDTVVVLNGMLMLHDETGMIITKAETSEPCININVNPGVVKGQACYAEGRIVIAGQSPLTILNVSDHVRSIQYMAERRSSVELTVWSVTGDLLATHTDVMREPIATVNFDQEFPPLVFVKLRSGDVYTVIGVLN